MQRRACLIDAATRRIAAAERRNSGRWMVHHLVFIRFTAIARHEALQRVEPQHRKPRLVHRSEIAPAALHGQHLASFRRSTGPDNRISCWQLPPAKLVIADRRRAGSIDIAAAAAGRLRLRRGVGASSPDPRWRLRPRDFRGAPAPAASTSPTAILHVVLESTVPRPSDRARSIERRRETIVR